MKKKKKQEKEFNVKREREQYIYKRTKHTAQGWNHMKVEFRTKGPATNNTSVKEEWKCRENEKRNVERMTRVVNTELEKKKHQSKTIDRNLAKDAEKCHILPTVKVVGSIKLVDTLSSSHIFELVNFSLFGHLMCTLL